MTNLELEDKLETLVGSERQTTLEILRLIQEAEDRRLPLKQGFSSTHDWLIKKYGYSGSAANRRVQAARYLRSVAGGTEKLAKGEVNLTTLSKVQSAIVREERRMGERMRASQKEEILTQVTGKTEEVAEKVLFSLIPEASRKETLRPVNGEESRLSVVLEAEVVEALKRVKDLLSHVLPGATWAEVIAYLAKNFTPRKTKPGRQRGALPKYSAGTRTQKPGVNVRAPISWKSTIFNRRPSAAATSHGICVAFASSTIYSRPSVR